MYGIPFLRKEAVMKVYFYDTRITEDFLTVLVKVGSFSYDAEKTDSPNAVARMAESAASLRSLAEEHCYIIAMNTGCRPLGMFLISKGSVSQSYVGIREIFIRALLVGASHIVLLHNHPSGNCTPSSHDILLTKRLEKAGNLLEIPLSDHIIVGRDSFYSFREHDMLGEDGCI